MNFSKDGIIESANKEISHLESLIKKQVDGEVKSIMISNLKELKRKRDMVSMIFGPLNRGGYHG